MKKHRLLVYHAGALGDFITTLPAIKLFKKAYPNGFVMLLGKPEFGALARDNGIIDTVWDINKREYGALFNESAESVHEPLLTGFTAALLFCADDSPLLAVVRKKIAVVLYQRPFPREKIAIVRYHCSLFRQNGFVNNTETEYLRFYVDAKKVKLAASSKKTIALHPGSGSSRKNWPLTKFCQLRERISAHGHRVIWILGPAEESIEPPFKDKVLRNQNLQTVARTLAACQLLVGNDSGIAHLAAAVDIPVVALFGPSDPDIWKPFGRSVSVIDARPTCRPCHPLAHNRRACPKNCLETIAVETVYDHCILLI